MGGVFIGSEALGAGLVTRHQLRTRYRRIFPNIYGPPEPSVRDRARAAFLWSGRRGVIAGVAASALHHAKWVDDDVPIELLWRNTHPPTGLIVRNESWSAGEVMTIADVRVTTAARTIFDLGRHLPRNEAVARIDALLTVGRITIDDVAPLLVRHPRATDIRRLTTALALVDAGAESPQETRLRLALTDAGMPPDRTQIPVVDGQGRIVARVDMGWEHLRVAVQYDGRHHQTDRATYVRDQKVNRALEARGWVVIRVIAEDSLADVVGRVAAALYGRGWRAA
ncbi:hypothetical protein [Mycolicibacterium neoaurum]|uniref:Cullin, a subunit of E3 ubiquitin ligase n=1 Tax=Mycolicibacterium neoaurum TaxID=1795 RepID=A0AAV2WRI5_MYCNE|nr:hypothetical protein [Mycolicibacterium neoaurum]TLH59072.1 hypothetical protein C1S81_13430 [Mycolicibacterium neoaurum]CDQ46959.1 hypothetical protein BN1047_04876 [Mycolicibacterium neoaurum]